MNQFNERVALITGGGKGIGYGIARAYAARGASLMLTGRTEKTLKKAAAELKEEFSAPVSFTVADGSDEKNVKEIIQSTIDKYGKLNVVVNNAQASKSGVLLKDHTKEDFDLAIYSGLYATFFMMREAYPYLKESQGSVINFASGAGLSGKPAQSSYAAAKEGIRGLSRVAATEWGSDNININTICPLAMTEQLAAWKAEYPDIYKKTIQAVPMGRFADSQKDIGGLCLFLSSEEGHYITGETITVQGGSGLRP